MTLFFMASITKHIPIKLAANAQGAPLQAAWSCGKKNRSGKQLCLHCMQCHLPLSQIPAMGCPHLTLHLFFSGTRKGTLGELGSPNAQSYIHIRELIEVAQRPQTWGHQSILWHHWHGGDHDPVPPHRPFVVVWKRMVSLGSCLNNVFPIWWNFFGSTRRHSLVGGDLDLRFQKPMPFLISVLSLPLPTSFKCKLSATSPAPWLPPSCHVAHHDDNGLNILWRFRASKDAQSFWPMDLFLMCWMFSLTCFFNVFGHGPRY